MSESSPVLVTKDQTIEYLSSPMIEVKVGNDDTGKSFFVYEQLITSRSNLFRNALQSHDNGKSREGDTHIARLPEADPSIFSSYMQILYQPCLPLYPPTSGKKSKNDVAELRTRVEEYTHLAELYVFCEKIQDIDAKWLLIHAFVEASLKRVRPRVGNDDGPTFHPPSKAIRDIFEGTNKSDPLREWLIHLFVEEGYLGCFATRPEDHHPDFLKGIAICEKRKKKDASRYSARVRDANHYANKLVGFEES